MQNYPVGKKLTLNVSIMTAADAGQNFCIWRKSLFWFPKVATKTAANIDGTATSFLTHLCRM